MSTNPNNTKPITGAFELQTKIRVIIQQLISATVRKLSNLTQKVEKFQDFFIVYKENFELIEKNGIANTNAIHILSENVNGSKQELSKNIILVDQKFQKIRLENQQIKEQLKDINKKLSTIHRQSEAISNDFGKAKAKFLQYSDIISNLKEEVSWKISKYVEQTIHLNTQIKMNSDQIKKDYFNVLLTVDKQKQRYEQIVILNQQQVIQEQNTREQLNALTRKLIQNQKTIESVAALIKATQNQLISKNKQLEIKYDMKFQDIYKSNESMIKSVKQVQAFSYLLETIRNQNEQNNRNILKKIQDGIKKNKQLLDSQILTVNKDKLKMERNIDKRLNEIQSKQQRNQDFFLQKIQYVKHEIQNEISLKTSALLQQKSKTQNLAQDAIASLNERMNTISNQSRKSINKVESIVRELKTEVKNKLQDVTIQIAQKVQRKVIISMQENGISGGGGSSIIMTQKLEQIKKIFQFKLQGLYKSDQQMKQNIKQSKQQFVQFEKKMKQNMKDTQDHLNQKVQKMMFLLTKMRGDSIIRNQFTDKEIKQIKKHINEEKKIIDPLLKSQPAFGQMLNLIMCLIFDAQYQHSRVIQDNLPQLEKDIQKFNTIIEGNIYQYKEKKKLEVKKIQLVKAAYWAYLQLWDNLFQGQYKNMPQMIPKTFFKKHIEKNIGLKTPLKANISKQLQSNDNNQGMNQSFQIRKTKNMKSFVRSKEDVIFGGGLSDEIGQ